MKKMMFYLACILLTPCVLTFAASLFNKDIQIGGGGNTLESKYMGKEVLIEMNGLYKSMDVEEYVLGILPGTIPADYDIEALKVQAVLIRTNVLKEMQEKNTEDAADLSYRYMTVEERTAIWGDRNYENYETKMERAVIKTAGEVIEQENSLIMALYHEVSIGKTASAKEILGEEISYLQSVESSQDVEAKHYMNIITYTWEELGELLNGAVTEESGTSGTSGQNENVASGTKVSGESGTSAENELSGQTGQASEGAEEIEALAENTQSSPEEGTQSDAEVQRKTAVQIEESTENGFVKKLTVAGNPYTGEEAMQKFHLASANFYVEEIEGGIRFICLGKGSCLGVSQYGANNMALNGKRMDEIIKYYYKGVSLSKYGR